MTISSYLYTLLLNLYSVYLHFVLYMYRVERTGYSIKSIVYKVHQPKNKSTELHIGLELLFNNT